MRIPCPLCGPRDRREFYYYGTPDYMDRPDDLDSLDAQLFVRTNPAGETRDLWYHENGCGAWMTLTRNTVTHAILGAELVMDRVAGTRVSALTVDAKPQIAKPQTPKTQKGA